MPGGERGGEVEIGRFRHEELFPLPAPVDDDGVCTSFPDEARA
jgi:hypothetical protein